MGLSKVVSTIMGIISYKSSYPNSNPIATKSHDPLSRGC